MLISTALAQALELAEQAVDLVSAAAQGGYCHDDGYALIAAEPRLRAVEERLMASRLAMLPKIDTSGAWRIDYLSVGKFNTWLAQHDNIAKSTANWEVRQATQLRDDLPATLQRALTGATSASEVKALCCVAATSDARKAALRSQVVGWESESYGSAAGAVQDGIATGQMGEPGQDGAEPQPDDESMQDAGQQNPAVAGEIDANATAKGALAGEAKGAIAGAAMGEIDGEAKGEVNGETVGTSQCAPTGEEYLLDMAAAVPLYQFNRLVHRFAHVADPEADERGYKEAKDREYFEISPTLGGYHLAGFLTEEHGQQVKIAIDNLVNTTLITNDDIVTARAERTDSQRRAQGLADLAQLAMDTGLLGVGAIERREIVINISWTEFLTLCNQYRHSSCATELNINRLTNPINDYASFADGRGPIPRSVLKRLACDSNIRRIIFGPDSQILDVGRTQRTVPPHVRTAVIARDKHCVYPNCDQPAQRCEVHHAVTHWSDGGDTTAENAALLCWHHHAHVDDNGIMMRWDNLSGTWKFTTKHGQPLTTRPKYNGTLAA